MRAVQRENILDDKLSRITVLTILVLFDIEPDDVIAFGEQSFGPSAEAAEKINGERFAQNANSSVAC